MEEVLIWFSDKWLYLAIPVISALVGWGTNILALRMTFQPLEFIGIPPYLGWQGIIPNRAAFMAGKAVDLLTENLITIEERFNEIDPHKVVEKMEPELNRISKRIINEVMDAQAPLVWFGVPGPVKQNIYQRAGKDLPKIMEEMVGEIKSKITEFFDLKDAVIKTLTRNKILLNRMFLKCGEEEFKFIERSGLYFGFLFGLIQMVLWYFFQPWWLLPLGGLFIGYATNWLAIKLIFHPLHPRRILFWKVHGIFLKRQKEVSAEYGKIVAHEILNAKNIYENLLYGKASDKLVSIIQEHVQKAIDTTAGQSKEFIKLIAGEKKYGTIKNLACSGVMEDLRVTVSHLYGYTEEALDMENTLRDRMASLPYEDFQGFLRPVFQEDEFKLILVGGILGCMAGFIQLLLFSI